jgi:type I restriction enzyme S subunit
MKKIEDCLSKNIGMVGKIKTQDYLLEWGFPVIDQGKDFIAGYSNDGSLVYTGELPVIIYGDHTNIVKYVDFPFICWADWTKILKPKDDTDPIFFVYALELFKPETQWYRRHYSLLKQIQIPLPPLEIQKAIVAKLDQTFTSLDQAITLTQTNLNHLDELKKSVLNKAFDPKTFDIYISLINK